MEYSHSETEVFPAWKTVEFWVFYEDIKGDYFGAFSGRNSSFIFIDTLLSIKISLHGLFFLLSLLCVWWHLAVSRTPSLRRGGILQPCPQKPHWADSPGLSSCKRLSPGSLAPAGSAHYWGGGALLGRRVCIPPCSVLCFPWAPCKTRKGLFSFNWDNKCRLETISSLPGKAGAWR